jgi:hypothetical protein
MYWVPLLFEGLICIGFGAYGLVTCLMLRFRVRALGDRSFSAVGFSLTWAVSHVNVARLNLAGCCDPPQPLPIARGISGSRALSAFLVEDGALMIVASTIVPVATFSPLAARCRCTSSNSCRPRSNR